MKKYFEIKLNFNHQHLESIVEEVAFNNYKKGYICFVDLTSLVYSYEHEDFKQVLNNALVNSCDGSYIAMFASKIHKEKLKQYIGPEFFEKFIFKEGKHIIIGSTPRIFDKIIERVELEGGSKDNISYLELPFKSVNEFDYDGIASIINKNNVNYIWVSLGAPKQEYFMSKLLPHIDKGVLLGIGAALNYFSGEIKDIPNWTKKANIVWIYRLITEPKKQMKRLKSIFLIFPKMIREEKDRILKHGN